MKKTESGIIDEIRSISMRRKNAVRAVNVIIVSEKNGIAIRTGRKITEGVQEVVQDGEMIGLGIETERGIGIENVIVIEKTDEKVMTGKLFHCVD